MNSLCNLCCSRSSKSTQHDLALLPNGDLMVVFRTEAGDGNGHYGPYYLTKVRRLLKDLSLERERPAMNSVSDSCC